MEVHVFSEIYEFSNEFAELLRMFYRDIQIKITDDFQSAYTNVNLLYAFFYDLVDNEAKLTILIYEKGKIIDKLESRLYILENDVFSRRRTIKNNLKIMLYDFLADKLNTSLAWGSLTGVGPTKIVHNLLDKYSNLTDDLINKHLWENYRLSQEKADLIVEIAKIQRNYIKNNHNKKISLYINIPICSSKCLFCSFPSTTIDHSRHLIDDYLISLKKEMNALKFIIKEYGIELDSIYVGGGTPTVLDIDDLENLLSIIDHIWLEDDIGEYTVEAGRPDSLSKEKLVLLKARGVSRISINPQSMRDETLKTIGRNHSSLDIIRSFNDARDIGFDNINMDIILGLPGEGLDDVIYTMDKIRELNPDSLTAHSLAIKRSSRLKDNIEKYQELNANEAAEMMDYVAEGALSLKMEPYYLYRQKYITGNLENVGFSKIGKESIYNIQSMLDRQTILAFGAGAITKIYYPNNNRIERLANIKDIELYNVNIDSAINKKISLLKETYNA